MDSASWSPLALVGQLADMVRSARPGSALSVASVVAATLAAPNTRAADPCAAIANQTWVAPSAVRACYQSFKVNATEKSVELGSLSLAAVC
jgi:hypothetical protein